MKEKLKNITKTDIIAFVIYLIVVIIYLILNEHYFKLSPRVKILLPFAFLGSVEFYRNVIFKKNKLINNKSCMKKVMDFILKQRYW